MSDRKTFSSNELIQLLLIKERIFEISMFCKKQGWHKAGLHLCAGSDELEKIVDELLINHIKRDPIRNERSHKESSAH